ncbi:hypothetical protein AC623_05560 [Bacillus sp. FJAT-27231]|uniref:stalk domain-containing protein n=1 Tax=Bacillus sp. FJAT-27231 TaxID=1679168 RepID=UPI000670D981|nr:stalk domain-containing protein [Bacillus sp. FJAT-27231]KMY53517.1 hypothetical protein AC623_05560 [Bacillus sp. FJAT-27231]
MLKKSVFFIFFLIVVCGAILLIQWIGYEKASKASREIKVDQEVHIEHSEAGLFVKHTFTGLEAEEPLSVIMPAAALQASCDKNEGTCSFRGQSVSIVPSGETMSIMYSIKMPSFQTAFVLSDWAIKIKEATVEHTIIHFTEKKIRKGMWFSSLGPPKVKKLDLIDYYLFQGKGQPGSLYWQLKPLTQLESKEKLDVYGESKNVINDQQLELLREALTDRTAIIFTAEYPAFVSDRLVVVKNNEQLSRLTERFVTEVVLDGYRFQEGEEWLGQLIVSYKLGRPTGSEKIKMMYNRLNEQLNERERTEWKQLLVGLIKESITAEQLDRKLSAVKGLDTNFFVSNKNENDPFQPLVFYESRQVIINGKKTEIRPVSQNGQLFFPFNETLQALGYEVKKVTDGNSLLVRREYNTYYFYPLQNRFILNDERYGLYEKALQTYNGQLYMNQKWLQKIFLVAVQSEKTINVLDLDL